MYIGGSIQTYNTTLFGGAGAPSTDNFGYGGSYGGSGGRPDCTTTNDANQTARYYSNTDTQIGTLDISESDPAVFGGSGGGNSSSGARGGASGGFIAIYSNTMIIDEGELSADGAPASGPVTSRGGSGSGGSVRLVTSTLSVTGAGGKVSASGGDSMDLSAGAGGGGRVYIFAGDATGVALLDVRTAPGSNAGDAALCLNGAGGTYYFSSGRMHTVTVSNSHIHSEAVTLLTDLPDEILNVNYIERSAVVNNVLATHQSGGVCYGGDSYCGSVSVDNSTLLNTYYFNSGSLKSGPLTISSGNTTFRNSGSLYARDIYVHVITDSLMFDVTSSLTFSNYADITTGSDSLIYGRITQLDSYSQSNVNAAAGLIVNSTGEVLVADTVVVGALLFGDSITLVESSSFSTGPSSNFYDDSVSVGGCYADIPAATIPCVTSGDGYIEAANQEQLSSLILNGTVIMRANSMVDVQSAASLTANAIFVCAVNMSVARGGIVSAEGGGCLANYGRGAGGPPPSEDDGGGGGAHTGDGGYGTGFVTSSNGGISYGNIAEETVSAGSGGGCSGAACIGTVSSGGGIVSIQTDLSIYLDGSITVAGQSGGLSSGGGGGGGALVVNTSALTGGGNLSAIGGDGGTGGTINGPAGGGGGGGHITVYNGVNGEFEFTGFLYVNGGYGVSCPDSSQNSGPGGAGTIIFPNCSVGKGNTFTTPITICEPCALGYYKDNSYATACSACDSIPDHAHYDSCGNAGTGCETPSCPFSCNPGYATENCVNPFDLFIGGIGGVAGFSALVCAVAIAIAGPIVYYRYQAYLRSRQDWRQLSKAHLEFLPSFNDELNVETNSKPVATAVVRESLTTTNPLQEKYVNARGWNVSRQTSATDFVGGLHKQRSRDELERWIAGATNRELRTTYKLIERDLNFHAGRVYLNGSNQTLKMFGGQWKLPTNRPVSLRPMLSKDEYRKFADLVNSEMACDIRGWVSIASVLLAPIAPPIVSWVQYAARHARTRKLVSLIAMCKHECFRSPSQRDTCSSLRVGVSPDCTLAYIDFLCDDPESCFRPLGAVGQPELPIAFRFYGTGSYTTPWQLDTNDTLLQAIGHCREATVFVDEAWIAFIVELNSLLRKIVRRRVWFGLISLINFLRSESVTESLGGLVIEFCTFSNSIGGRYVVEDDETAAKTAADKKRAATGKTSKRFSAEPAPVEPSLFDTNEDAFGEGRRTFEVESDESTGDSRFGGDTFQHSVCGDGPISPLPNVFRMASRDASTDPTGKSFCSGLYSDAGRTVAALEAYLVNGTIDPNDPDFDSVRDFNKVCALIQEGHLCPGIRVSHPDSGYTHRPFLDSDFPSDDEDVPIDEELGVEITKGDTATPLKGQQEEYAEDLRPLTPPSISPTKVAASDKPKLAGKKAAEMEKFYRIMESAQREEELSSQREDALSSAAAGAAPEDAGMYSGEDRFSLSRFERKAGENAPPDEASVQSSELKVEPRQHTRRTTTRKGSLVNKEAVRIYSARQGLDGLDCSLPPSGYLAPVLCWNVTGTDEYDVVCGDVYVNGNSGSGPGAHPMKSSESASAAIPVVQVEQCMSVDSRTAVQRSSAMCIYTSSHSKERLNIGEKGSILGSIWVQINRFFAYLEYYTEQAIMTQNVDAVGPAATRPLLGILFCLLSIVDIFGAFYLLVIYNCIFNVTSCDNHSGMILIISVYPGALVLAPLAGIFATTLGPNAKYAKAYSIWSRLAVLSMICTLLIYISFANDVNLDTGYVVAYMILARIIQCFLIDYYIAHIERMRWGRGWDGLSTCLYVTKDHRWSGREHKD